MITINPQTRQFFLIDTLRYSWSIELIIEERQGLRMVHADISGRA
jgi:hypothetical protein